MKKGVKKLAILAILMTGLLTSSFSFAAPLKKAPQCPHNSYVRAVQLTLAEHEGSGYFLASTTPLRMGSSNDLWITGLGVIPASNPQQAMSIGKDLLKTVSAPYMPTAVLVEVDGTQWYACLYTTQNPYIDVITVTSASNSTPYASAKGMMSAI